MIFPVLLIIVGNLGLGRLGWLGATYMLRHGYNEWS